ncbi:transposase [Archangium violaceum]|uniref:transposase n=1 Tax=Archangium violaceum TaxID=83451 RepID=UPI00193BBD95|nr:transposase [Archangium violaceum]
MKESYSIPGCRVERVVRSGSTQTVLVVRTERRGAPCPSCKQLLFTGLELLRHVASLVPPPRTNLTRFHGVFAPGAKR